MDISEQELRFFILQRSKWIKEDFHVDEYFYILERRKLLKEYRERFIDG